MTRFMKLANDYALDVLKILFYEKKLFKKSKILFNRDLNRGCLVYMFSWRFSGSKFLINLRRQFRVRKIYRTQGFIGFTVFSFCV